MKRSQFLATICALFTAPFIGKSKEKDRVLVKNISPKWNGIYEAEEPLTYPRLATQADIDLYNPENGLHPHECDWLITEKDGVKHITHQYINGKWVDVNELKF